LTVEPERRGIQIRSRLARHVASRVSPERRRLVDRIGRRREEPVSPVTARRDTRPLRRREEPTLRIVLEGDRQYVRRAHFRDLPLCVEDRLRDPPRGRGGGLCPRREVV